MLYKTIRYRFIRITSTGVVNCIIEGEGERIEEDYCTDKDSEWVSPILETTLTRS